MDRFILAENPIKNPNSDNYNQQYIVHTIAPECIIEVLCLNDVEQVAGSHLPWQKFEHINPDGVAEVYQLVVSKAFGMHGQKQLFDLLPRAWRWYRTYLEWEDKNIDIQEEGKWN